MGNQYFELNDYENTTYQKLWNATKAVLKGTFTPLNTDILERRKFSVQ